MSRRTVAVFLIAVSVIAAISIAIIRPWSTRNDDTPDANATALAPEPFAPGDDSYFVDPTVTLTWTWPVPLTEDQVFAVRVWYENDDTAYREAWVDTPAYDATDAINSYLQDIGDYHWQVAVINVQNGGAFDSMGSQWSPVQTLHRVRHISPTPVPVEQRSAAAQLIMASNPPDATAVIDAARTFVSTNALHYSQGVFKPDYSDALDMMVEYVEGKGDMPNLVCDGLSTAMLTLLAEFGIDSRLIFLYSDNKSQIGEHTVLEVFNPDTQQWEVHDTSGDRYLVDENGDRVPIERLVFGDLSITSVCDRTHTCTPFYDANYAPQDYFEAFRYGHTETFWVNPDRFDISKRFPDNNNVNLAEYETGNPRDFAFRFDNWNKPAP